MIHVENLTKYFDNFCALDNVCLHVPKGVTYCLVGPNGSGKSTLLRHITGIYCPDKGKVTIDGESVFENAALKSRICYIPDNIFYFLQADTLEMKRFYSGLYPHFDHQLFEKLSTFFPSLDVKKSIRKLSKGNQKQSAFLLAICCNPEILILDEPIDGLDPIMRRQLWNLISKNIHEKELTVLISSHNLRELEDVCDYVGIMHKGRIILERSLYELQNTVCKIQIALNHGVPSLPPKFEILHMSNIGRVYTIIVKGDPQEAKKELEKSNPLLIDLLPLTLEEIFIYEIGGNDYAFKNILL